MYKVTTRKNGSAYFMTIDEVCIFLEKMGSTLYENHSFVKISFVEDFEI